LQAILSCAAAPPHDASLLDLGIDSLTAAELRNAIERSTGAAVPVELFIDGSSLQSIVDVVASQVERRLVTTQSRNSATVMEEITL